MDSILDENAGIAADYEGREAESDGTADHNHERIHSVSDEIGARIACTPPLEERQQAGDALGLKMLSPASGTVAEGSAEGEEEKSGTFGSEEVTVETHSPMTAGLSRKATTRADMTVSTDRDHAAQHYAHDVENMQALQSQIAAMRLPGPVRWMQEQAARRLNRGGAEGGSSKVGDSSKGNSSKQAKDLLAAQNKGSDFV